MASRSQQEEIPEIKKGHPIDVSFYKIKRTTADSLLALRFDAVGYKKEAVTIGVALGQSRNVLLSSKTSKALLVMQFLQGNVVWPLVKKSVDGEDRFYNPDHEDNYYVINREKGMMELYVRDWQEIIEN